MYSLIDVASGRIIMTDTKLSNLVIEGEYQETMLGRKVYILCPNGQKLVKI